MIKTVSVEDYNKKVEEFEKLKAEIANLKPSNHWAYTKDELSFNNDGDILSIMSNYDNWDISRSEDDVFYLKIYDVFNDTTNGVVLTVNQMMHLTDYLNEKLQFIVGGASNNE